MKRGFGGRQAQPCCGTLGVFAAPVPSKTDLLARLPLHFEPSREMYVAHAPHYRAELSPAASATTIVRTLL